MFIRPRLMRPAVTSCDFALGPTFLSCVPPIVRPEYTPEKHACCRRDEVSQRGVGRTHTVRLPYGETGAREMCAEARQAEREAFSERVER